MAFQLILNKRFYDALKQVPLFATRLQSTFSQGWQLQISEFSFPGFFYGWWGFVRVFGAFRGTLELFSRWLLGGRWGSPKKQDVRHHISESSSILLCAALMKQPLGHALTKLGNFSVMTNPTGRCCCCPHFRDRKGETEKCRNCFQEQLVSSWEPALLLPNRSDTWDVSPMGPIRCWGLFTSAHQRRSTVQPLTLPGVMTTHGHSTEATPNSKKPSLEDLNLNQLWSPGLYFLQGARYFVSTTALLPIQVLSNLWDALHPESTLVLTA